MFSSHGSVLRFGSPRFLVSLVGVSLAGCDHGGSSSETSPSTDPFNELHAHTTVSSATHGASSASGSTVVQSSTATREPATSSVTAPNVAPSGDAPTSAPSPGGESSDFAGLSEPGVVPTDPSVSTSSVSTTQPSGSVAPDAGSDSNAMNGSDVDIPRESRFECPTEPGAPNWDATPEVVEGVPLADGFGAGFSIIEGPVWLNGALYFSHIANNSSPHPSRIIRLTEDSGPQVWVSEAYSNGLAIDTSGDLLMARHSDGSITRLEPNSMRETNLTASAPWSFNSPNDLAVRSDGNIYFTDPSWQRPAGRTPAEYTGIYRSSPQGEITLIDGTKQNPNGINLSLDERWLYVAGQMPLTRYPVGADGAVGSGETVGDVGASLQGADGMAFDCGGRLYVTNNQSVRVIDTTSGDFPEVATIQFPGVSAVTNVAFGGPQRTTLYVTSLGTDPKLFRVELGVVGFPY